MKIIFALALISACALLVSQPAAREQVGPLPDGSFLLNSGWRISPAGRQVPLDTFPMSSALSPDGKFLLILNGGYRPPTISVLDTANMVELDRVPVKDAWLGLTFANKGKTVYVGGGSQSSIFEFAFADGKLTPARTFVIVPEKDPKTDKPLRTHEDFVGDVATDGRLLYATMLYRDSIAVINPQSGMVIEHFKTGRRPYRIQFHPDGKSFFVTGWADGAVHHHQSDNGDHLAALRLGSHPNDIVWSARKTSPEAPYAARMFVAAGNTNSVYVIGVSPAKDLQIIETINVAMTPREPAGMTPSALALNADESRLYVVCSDANAVAVADVTEERSRVLGFIPTGWYPTGARSLADGKLIVLNGRGGRSYPNPNGPNPTRRPMPVHQGGPALEYVGRIQTGTASVIDPFDDTQLAANSLTVMHNSPYSDSKLDDAGVPRGNPVPTHVGDPSPIEHVVYVLKENRTYDQVLGDMKEGNGDASLVLFGEQVTPNHHKLAREFVLFDNFYVSADVSADGHNWSSAAIAPDYVQKMWPNSYAGRRKKYDYEGADPATSPPAGYLWNNALAKGLAVRNYGWWSVNVPKPSDDGPQIQMVKDPALRPHTDLKYRGFDLDYPDVNRAREFIADFARLEQSGQMPRLMLLRLGNDHTSTVAAGKIAPLSAVADNDYALGMVVEALSKSKFWPKTVIFVLEDDAQNGADHVDSHRSPAFVISPFTRRAAVDSSMYNTTSMLRTIELILGLNPMTHFDAGAKPMFAAFTATARTDPYQAEKPRIPVDARNPEAGVAAARAARFDFSEADREDDDEINDMLWRAIRGTEPPAPRSSFFSAGLNPSRSR